MPTSLLRLVVQTFSAPIPAQPKIFCVRCCAAPLFSLRDPKVSLLAFFSMALALVGMACGLFAAYLGFFT